MILNVFRKTKQKETKQKKATTCLHKGDILYELKRETFSKYFVTRLIQKVISVISEVNLPDRIKTP